MPTVLVVDLLLNNYRRNTTAVTTNHADHTMINSRPLLPVLVLFISSTAFPNADGEIGLKKIMQDLQSDSALIVEGLLVENFETIDDAARRIANHPRIPPPQVALVAAELGSEMPNFKRLDTLVHDLALSIGDAAQEADAASIADNYKRMLDGCLACHASYRQRVSKVLSSK